MAVVRSCELCESPARMYCESDQASLCWDCDSKVHSANFLVARHSRTLLCQGCQSLTPWSAAGAKLGPTVSICEKCSCGDGVAAEERESEIDGGDEFDLEDDDTDEEEEDDDDVEGEDEDEDEGENQVVPWSHTPPPPPSPPAASSSSDEDEFSDLANSSLPFSLKRNRESSSDLRFQENIGRSIRHRPEIIPALATTTTDIENGISRRLRDNGGTAEPDFDRTVHGRTGSIKESTVRIERDIASCLNTPAGITTGLCKLS